MASFTVQEWWEVCENTSRVLKDLDAEVAGKVREGAMKSWEKKNYQRKVEGFDKTIKKLERSLKKHSNGDIGPGETNRRQSMLMDLKRLKSGIESTMNGQARRDLDRLYRAEDRYQENDRSTGNSNQQLMQQQEKQFQDQDHKLDLLSAGLGQLGNMGDDIHQQLLQQGDLLDDLDDATDRVQGRLLASTEGVEGLEEGSTSCWTYICILILFLLIIFLAFTNYACYIFNRDKC